MGDEVAQRGGCEFDELDPIVVTEVYEAIDLVHVVGCCARPVGLSCPCLESGEVWVTSWK